jgi:cytochrome b subunit of formate dehydrogenase
MLVRCALKKNRWFSVLGALLGVALFLAAFYSAYAPASTVASTGEEAAVVPKKQAAASEPRIIVAMKTSMYEQVADDEDIELMAQWIKDGAKNDEVFNKEIFPILKNDCRNCHSKNSTMTKAVPHIPFAGYADVKKFTAASPTNADCMACHGASFLQEPPEEKHKALFVSTAKFQNSVHKKLRCVRCHVELHPETDTIYQDTDAFKKHILKKPAPADADRHQIFKPACTNCHPKAGAKLQASAHVPQPQKPELKSPKCIDCHGGQHEMTDPKLPETRFAVVKNCGACHEKLTKTYFASYHGKAAKLGGDRVAKCVNCHGSHDLLSPSDPKSTLHANNIQKTCQECHPKANANFTSFQPHADHQDRAKYPQLFYTFWIMTSLLVGTFLVFGIHSLLWLRKSLSTDYKEPPRTLEDKEEIHIKRFNVSHTILHLMLIVSFTTLAITGMALKFPDNPLFSAITRFAGGPHMMGLIHRFGAIITFTYFGLHLLQLAALFIKRKITFKGLFKEEYSLILLPRDLKQLKANLLYFIGKGPKPKFGRWTYWEKFDYMAEFWGVGIISITGLALAFPETATRLLPGWTLNVATIIHSFEALLATGFIFSIHFFNSHVRPETFPMDTVIFTQRLPLTKFKEERTREYEQLVENGELDKFIVAPPSKWHSRISFFMGSIFLFVGLMVICAIIYSLLHTLF